MTNLLAPLGVKDNEVLFLGVFLTIGIIPKMDYSSSPDSMTIAVVVSMTPFIL